MTRKTGLATSGLALALALAGCQEQITDPVLQPGSAVLDQVGQVSVGRVVNPLPIPSGAQLSDQTLGRAIDPTDYVCPAEPTPVISWYIDEFYTAYFADPAPFAFIYNYYGDLIPLYDALLFATTDEPQYFGYDGEFTKVINKAERENKRFWDIESSDIQVLGMHGTTLMDVERSAQAFEIILLDYPGLVPALASLGIDSPTEAAEAFRAALIDSDGLNGGNHPLFSFNAFAFTTFGGPIPDKIVMGDGILAGYEALGFGDVAAQAIFAHEFAHHIQFENDYFSDPYAAGEDVTAPESTRYTEMMADAFAAYYLTHKRGGTMNRKRVEQFLEVFYQIGDCSFASPGHHGTPNQRLAAARFGFDLADQAQKQGHILSSEEFHALFVAEYPELIAPDA